MSYTIIENEPRYQAAIEARIKANARKTRVRKFYEENADAELILAYIRQQGSTRSKFWQEVAEGVEEYGSPRPRIIEIVRERMVEGEKRKAQWRAEREALEANSQHFGEVGKRIEFEAVCTFTTAFEGTYGYVFITGYRTPEGNVAIHKGSTNKAERGKRYAIKATIKNHGEREGVKQTMISRPVIKELEG